MELLRQIKKISPDMKAIMITAVDDEDIAGEAMRGCRRLCHQASGPELPGYRSHVSADGIGSEIEAVNGKSPGADLQGSLIYFQTGYPVRSGIFQFPYQTELGSSEASSDHPLFMVSNSPR